MDIKAASTSSLKIVAYDLSEDIIVKQNNLNVIMSEIRLRQQQPPTPEPEPEPEQPQSETVSDAKSFYVDQYVGGHVVSRREIWKQQM